jgi:sugar phosphate isomerase/epimerase
MGFVTSSVPVAVQLYSLRDAAETDMRGVLERVAAAGFRGVEYASLHGHPPAQVRRWATELGLFGVGIHRRLPAGPETERVLDEAAELGVDTVIVPWAEPERFASRATVGVLAEELAEANRLAATRGIRVGYHNHEHEPAAHIDGRTALEALFELAGPDLVAEVDIYWATVGGEDPGALITRIGPRARLLHVKDGPADAADRDAPQVALGHGRVDIAGALAAGIYAEWHIVELDSCATDMFDAVEAGRRWLASHVPSQAAG